MRRILAAVVGLSLVFATILAVPATTRADDDKAKIRGVIVAWDARGGTLHVQEFGNPGHRWTVILRSKLNIDDDDDRGVRALGIGDVVEVKGEFLGGRTILAKKIKILARGGGAVVVVPARPIPQPPIVQPAPPPASSSSSFLVSLIKTVGIGAAVRAFADPLNKTINTLLQNRGAAVQAQTKVVPILSITIGLQSPGGAYIGAAQVSGPAAAMQRVQAVALLEADYQTSFRIKAYVPVDNLKPWEAFRRVPGVGVSAIIDIRI